MRFKRISTDTVRCIVSQDELIENGLNMDDFMSNSGRAEDFLRRMLMQAEQEVGFKVQGGPLTIQVAALPENQLVLTFSEKQATESFRELIETLRAAMNHLSDEDSDKNSDKQPQKKQQEQNSNEGSDSYLLEFDSLDALTGFSAAVDLREIPSEGLESALYYCEDTDAYTLILEKGSLENKQLCRIVAASSEFLVHASADVRQISYVKEHGRCILRAQALEQLQSLFSH